MQNPLRVAARVLIGVPYVMFGLTTVRTPGKRVEQAASTLAKLRKTLPLPENDELLVRANGAAQIAGGALLVTGTLQRPAALLLAGSMVPTTFAGHAFWNIEDPVARAAQRTQFLKNAVMIGGLLFAVVD